MKFRKLPPKGVRENIPRTVWALGCVSLFMDISSEMIHAVLPLFMSAGLGASALAIGLTEGAAEGAALLTKVFSGVISDRFGHTKLLVFLGYALAVFTKPFFAMASSVEQVFFCRFADRIGKGLRGAPRDALIAAVTPKPILGAAFGLRQSLDSAGAFIGPALASVLLACFAESYRFIFWCALIPGAICLALIVLEVKAPEAPSAGRVNPLTRAAIALLPKSFWALIGMSALFSLARFSNAFIVLRAADCGIRPMLVPLVMVAMNFVFAFSSYPFGKLADRVKPTSLLCLGVLLLAAADAAFALGAGPAAVLAGVALWGLHLGATQGIFSMLIAHLAPEALRGTAFGLYNLVSGGSLLAAGVFAGVLSDARGFGAPFIAGIAFSALTLAALALLRRGALKGI